jgi:hypothetical protein
MTRIAPTTVLSNDQIISIASSAGATNPIADVSERYSFVPTISVVDMLRDSGWLPVKAGESSVRKNDLRGYQQHYVRFTRSELMFKDESIQLILMNSHNKGCAFKLLAGVFRFVCANGMIVGDQYANFTHRHIGFNADKFLISAKSVADSAEQIAVRLDDFKTIDLEPNEQGIYAKAVHNLLYSDDLENAPIQANSLLETRRYEDDKNDLWSVFNKVQENVIKGGLRGSKIGANGRRKNVTTRPVKSIDRDKKLNQALWILTEEMAELKKA